MTWKSRSKYETQSEASEKLKAESERKRKVFVSHVSQSADFFLRPRASVRLSRGIKIAHFCSSPRRSLPVFCVSFLPSKKKQQQHRSEEILKAPESAPCALNSKFKSLCISEAGPKKHRNRDLVRLISRNVKCLLWPYMALASPSSSSFSARKREQRCNKCCRSASQRTRGRGLLDEMRNEIFSLCFTKHHTFPFCCLACQPSRHGLPRIREMSTSPWPKRIFSQPFSLLNRRILYLENKIHLLLRSPNMFLSALFFVCALLSGLLFC